MCPDRGFPVLGFDLTFHAPPLSPSSATITPQTPNSQDTPATPMEPEKPAFAISVPSEDPKKKTDGDDAPKQDTNAIDSQPSQDAPSKEGKTEPSGDELVRPSRLQSLPELRVTEVADRQSCSF